MSAKTEFQKMLSGELYDASEDELVQLRVKARIFMKEYNHTDFDRKKGLCC